MTRILRFAVVTIAVVMTGPLGWAQAASGVRIAAIEGAVEVHKDDGLDVRPARPGAALVRGDRLVAKGKASALLLWANGSMVKVYPDTDVTLAGVTFDLEKKLESTILDLRKGRVFVKAQVPEHLFSEFTVRVGTLSLLTQGAEFALKSDPGGMTATAWSLLGRLVIGHGTEHVRIDDGRWGTVAAGTGSHGHDTVAAMDDGARQALMAVSKDLGGSILLEDEPEDVRGGRLAVKIGTRYRRGAAPYTVGLKARVRGGSGDLNSVEWDFGDGQTATGMEAMHTFEHGLYMVVLRVEDRNGDRASAQIGVSAEEGSACGGSS